MVYYQQWPLPGTVIFIWFLGIRHKGIVSDRAWSGKPMVIATSIRTNGVQEISWDEFTGGQEWFSEGYPSKLPADSVLWRARSAIGQPYNLFFANCRQFVLFAHDLPIQNSELEAIFATIALGLLAVAASRA